MFQKSLQANNKMAYRMKVASYHVTSYNAFTSKCPNLLILHALILIRLMYRANPRYFCRNWRESSFIFFSTRVCYTNIFITRPEKTMISFNTYVMKGLYTFWWQHDKYKNIHTCFNITRQIAWVRCEEGYNETEGRVNPSS